MRIQCNKCSARYDDAECDTICPHRLLRTPEMKEQWEAARRLLGKVVRFHHMPPGSGRLCHGMTFEGTVLIEGLSGEFAPHLFQIEPAGGIGG